MFQLLGQAGPQTLNKLSLLHVKGWVGSRRDLRQGLEVTGSRLDGGDEPQALGRCCSGPGPLGWAGHQNSPAGTLTPARWYLAHGWIPSSRVSHPSRYLFGLQGARTPAPDTGTSSFLQTPAPGCMASGLSLDWLVMPSTCGDCQPNLTGGMGSIFPDTEFVLFF